MSGVRATMSGVRVTMSGVRATMSGVRATMSGVRVAMSGVRDVCGWIGIGGGGDPWVAPTVGIVVVVRANDYSPLRVGGAGVWAVFENCPK